jgi:diguanylate cyclase (GGDEF)-like protein/PAS domain S-box-containing protein
MKHFARSPRWKTQKTIAKSSKMSIFLTIPCGDRARQQTFSRSLPCISLSIIALVKNPKIFSLFEFNPLPLSFFHSTQNLTPLLVSSCIVSVLTLLFWRKKGIQVESSSHKKNKAQDRSSDRDKLLELQQNLEASTRRAQHLQERLHYQTIITHLSQLSLAETNFEKVQQEAIRAIATTLEVEFIGIFELLSNESALILKMGLGWPKDFIGYAKIWLSQTSLAGYTLNRQVPVVFDDLPIETRFHASPLFHNNKIVSGSNLSICREKEIYGMLGVYSQRSRPFETNELEFLQAISEIIAAAQQKQKQLVQLNLFKRALDASSNSIVITDALAPNTPVTYTNPSFEKLTGYKAEELIGQESNCLYNEQIDPKIRQEIASAKLYGKEYHTVFQNYRRDGTPFWSELSLAPVLDPQGELTHYIKIQTDISDRYQAEMALRASEERFRLTFELAPIGMFIASLDGCYLQVNQALCQALGYSRGELVQKNQRELTHPDDRAADLAINQQLLLGEIDRFQLEKRFLARNEQIVCALLQGVVVKDDRGIPSHLLGQLVDISDRKQAEEALQASERRLEGILASIEDVVWSATADKLLPLYLNQAAETVYGRPVAEFFRKPELWFEIVHPEDRSRLKRQIQVLIGTGHAEIEYRILRPQGDMRWLYCRAHLVRDEDGQSVRIDGISSDITERKQAEARLRHNAFYDALTNLPNRASFIDRLWHTMRRASRRGGYLFAVLFLDLDWFKIVNDSLGHTLGDLLLVKMARRLESCLRPSDTVARLGGDEFTILLEELADPQDAIDIAEMILASLRSPFNLEGHEVFTNTSIGIAFSQLDYLERGPTSCSAIIYDRPEDFLRDADTAMYRAKALGKGRYAIFNSKMHASALARLQMETHLRRSLEREELFVCYQPIICLATGKLTGFEALLRWQHPEKGLISPAKFIPIAEETGAIVPIGAWILQEATRQLHLWQEQFPYYSSLTININLSGKQIRELDFIDTIDRILAKTGLSRMSLKLEITESVLMDNVEAATQMLLALRERNIQLCIDDFGTGYSSLSYLHRFPVNTLKIDRSFVKRMKPDGKNLEIVQAIVSLSRALDMDVVAEGIETETQLAQLKALGCKFGQGFFFFHPLTKNEVEDILKKG